MKLPKNILSTIHSLPEETRKLLAGIFLILAAVVVFHLWGTLISARLSSLSSLPETETAAGKSPTSPPSPSPTPEPQAGVLEGLRSLFKF